MTAMREIKTLRRVNHKNVIKLLEVASSRCKFNFLN